MQTQTLQNSSFASLFMGLVAASILLLGGVGGYAIRTLTVVAAPATRIVYVENTPAPGGSSQTTKAHTVRPQPR